MERAWAQHNKAVIQKIPDGAILVSTSSDQVEIDLEALKKLSRGRCKEVDLGKHEYTIGDGRWGTKKIIVLAEGYPINFYGSESVPNDTIDPVMTLLLLGGVELALDARKKQHVFKRGILTDEIDQITDDYELVVRFLQSGDSRN